MKEEARDDEITRLVRNFTINLILHLIWMDEMLYGSGLASGKCEA